MERLLLPLVFPENKSRPQSGISLHALQGGAAPWQHHGDGKVMGPCRTPWVLWPLSLSEKCHHRDRDARGGGVAGGISRGAQQGWDGMGGDGGKESLIALAGQEKTQGKKK